MTKQQAVLAGWTIRVATCCYHSHCFEVAVEAYKGNDYYCNRETFLVQDMRSTFSVGEIEQKALEAVLRYCASKETVDNLHEGV